MALELNRNTLKRNLLSVLQMNFVSPVRQRKLERTIAERAPRVLFVKQDIQDDLYCCPANSNAKEIIFSSLMRSGPVALFTQLNADFLIVHAEPDLECQVWREKVDDLGWYKPGHLEALQQSVPGRNFGQSDIALRSDDVDFSQYDIVISLDISVPSRITKKYPEVLWCYYIREPKTSSFRSSLDAPIPGYDLFFMQGFHPARAVNREHCLRFPYYLQYPGCFNELFVGANREQVVNTPSEGLFLEHHTSGMLTATQMAELRKIGSVRTTTPKASSGLFEYADGYQKSKLSTEEILKGLLKSKYFVQIGSEGRNLFGNADIEAICSDCLCLGDPSVHVHDFLYSQSTAVTSFEDLIDKLNFFESNHDSYIRALRFQQNQILYLCWIRPISELLAKWKRKLKSLHHWE